MKYKDLIAGLEKYGSTEHDICIHGLGTSPDNVCDYVVISPLWDPMYFSGLGTSEFLGRSDYTDVKSWKITCKNVTMTYIKTGIGSPVLMDAVLTLGVTSCRKILFLGTVGALDSKISIGDIIIPKYSICGDGASRYISSGILAKKDVFGEKVYPDISLLNRIKDVANRLCAESNVKWHWGYTFSIDTIFAQFSHIDEILNWGCNVIEMETAAAFRAGNLTGIPTAALLSVSDNTVANKSLVSGRTPEEIKYQEHVQHDLFPQIILNVFRD